MRRPGWLELDKMTQQNGALVGESTMAVENLREQAQRLAELVAVFHITDGAQARDGLSMLGNLQFVAHPTRLARLAR